MISMNDADVVVDGENRHRRRSGAVVAGRKRTGDVVGRVMRFVCEGLDSDVARSGSGIVVVWRKFAGKDPVRGKAKRVHDVRSYQIRITHGEPLVTAVISRACRRRVAEQNMS